MYIYRLVPLDKQPGVRPIGVGEVLRRICGKTVMEVIKNDIITSSNKLQMCSGQKAGGEAAVHAMRRVFESEEAEAVLLVDASNAFNSLNRKALLHNVKVICPIFANYVLNCYRTPARLFVIGGIELKSKEGTTQGDPIGMAVYATGITPLLDELMLVIAQHDQMVAFADDITATGKCRSLRTWWDNLATLGPHFGYFPQPKKSWLIVKEENLVNATKCFRGTNIKITTEGERHLGAVIGSEEYKEKYCKRLVQKWSEDLTLLTEIAVTQPQAAYACYVGGFQHKFTHFIRTIPGFERYLQPIEDVLRHQFIPALTGGKTINDNERELLSLPPRLGGLGLKNACQSAPIEHDNSKALTRKLQNDILGISEDEGEEVARGPATIKNERRQRAKEKLEEIRVEMSEEQKRINEANAMVGASNWLTNLPIKELGYDLNKQQFQDALRIRYSWSLKRLPTECVCGSKFDLAHSLSCIFRYKGL